MIQYFVGVSYGELLTYLRPHFPSFPLNRLSTRAFGGTLRGRGAQETSTKMTSHSSHGSTFTNRNPSCNHIPNGHRNPSCNHSRDINHNHSCNHIPNGNRNSSLVVYDLSAAPSFWRNRTRTVVLNPNRGCNRNLGSDSDPSMCVIVKDQKFSLTVLVYSTDKI